MHRSCSCSSASQEVPTLDLCPGEVIYVTANCFAVPRALKITWTEVAASLATLYWSFASPVTCQFPPGSGVSFLYLFPCRYLVPTG